MEHATSNANDADGHCRLPRKYMGGGGGGPCREIGVEERKGPSVSGEGGRGGEEEVRKT